MRQLRVGFALMVVGAAALGFISQALGQDQEVIKLKTTIQAEQRGYKAREPLVIRFTLTNISSQPMKVLKWFTPLDGFNSNMFQVYSKDGKPVLYLGRLMKRGLPQAKDYMTINPNQSISMTTTIGEAYAIEHLGEYSIQYRSRISSSSSGTKGLTAMEEVPQEIHSNTIPISLLESRQPEVLKILPSVEKGEKPNSKQYAELKSALSEGLRYANEAVGALREASQKSDRYQIWFGPYDESRWRVVKNHFDRIKDALAEENIKFTCDNDEDCYAYVYPARPYELYLGKRFWEAPPKGTDSKAGTLIHELSHFYAVAGTVDCTSYGQTSCRNLAKNNPGQAIRNADNHEYFAENSPPLP